MLMRLPLLLCCLLALLPSAVFAQAEAAPAVGDPAIVREFGRSGEPGSFRARFSRYGAGLVALQLMDHYASLEAARRSIHVPDDYLLLAWNGSDHGLRLLGNGVDPRLPVDLGSTAWAYTELPDGVQFQLAPGQGLELVKTLRHDPAERGFRLTIELRNTGTEPGGRLALQLLAPALVSRTESMFIGNSSLAIAATTAGDVKHVGVAAGTTQLLEVDLATLSFAGNTNRFFGAFLSPADAATAAALTGLYVDTVPPQNDTISGTSANTVARLRMGLSLVVPPRDASTRLEFALYLGPKSYPAFAGLREPGRLAPILDVDLNPPCCIDVPGGREMAKLLLWLLGIFHGLLGNWGAAIVLLTILVRGALAPLNFHMQKSMRAYGSRMAVLKPKLDALKTRYADDPKAYQQAMVAFQRENKLFPPVGGCLPILLTMPIYLGLFSALRTAYELRQQPFLFWIEDLSRADALVPGLLFGWDLNLLPLLWIGLYLLMVLRQPLPSDPQARQMQSIMRWMPVLIGVTLYGYAAALLIYMVTSMVWSLFESAMIKKILGPVDPNVAAMTPTPM